jgi:hypothetical protein
MAGKSKKFDVSSYGTLTVTLDRYAVIDECYGEEPNRRARQIYTVEHLKIPCSDSGQFGNVPYGVTEHVKIYIQGITDHFFGAHESHYSYGLVLIGHYTTASSRPLKRLRWEGHFHDPKSEELKDYNLEDELLKSELPEGLKKVIRGNISVD